MLILSADSACDICLDPYVTDGAKAPSSLACGHSFCRSCLYTLGTRICPVCRQPFSVVTDMRKIHVDFESKITKDVTKYELRALETCRSGDVQQMQDGVAEIEDWLSSQAPGLRSGLQTVVELVRLLMEATGQLHTALDRNQHEETRSRQRKELDEMKWTVEKRKMVQENEALREGLSRQREHLAYLELELAKARGHGHSQTQQHQPISMTTSTDPSRTKANTTDGHTTNNNNTAKFGNSGYSQSTGHGQDTPMHTRTPPRTPTKLKAPETTLNTSITPPSGSMGTRGGLLASPRQSSAIPVSERQTANTSTNTTSMSSSFPSPVSPPPHQLTQSTRSPPSSSIPRSSSSARAGAAVTAGRSSSTRPILTLPLPPPLTFETSLSSSISSTSHHAYTHSAPSAVTAPASSSLSVSRPTTPSKANIRATRGIGSDTSTPTPLGDANMNIKPTTGVTTGSVYGESMSRRGSTTQRLRTSLHGPRDRNSGAFESFSLNGHGNRGVNSGDVRPPGAAPSAFSSAMRGIASPTTYDPARSTSASPPPSSARRTSLPATSPSSFLPSFRQQPQEEKGEEGTEAPIKQESNKLRGHNRRSLQNTGATSSWVLVDSPPAVQSTQSDYFPSTSSRSGQAKRSGSRDGNNNVGTAWHQHPSMNEISMSDQSSMSLLKTVDDSFDSFSLLNSVTSTFNLPTTATYISPKASTTIPSLSSSMSGRAAAAGFSVASLPPRPARSHPPNITPTSSMPNTPIAEGTTGRNGVEQVVSTTSATTPILSSPPPSATVSSLSRKRALRRNTKEYNVEGLGV
ncbi:hypothetical protein CPB86DRAFT_779037 [Serendipita vermifera]|nr:hypothetical protein CPB86DRAFT_779037 [Serendipita vermifera]